VETFSDPPLKSLCLYLRHSPLLYFCVSTSVRTTSTSLLPPWILVKKSKGLPRQAEVAQGVPSRLRRRIFLTFRHYKGGRSSAKRTGRLYPGRNPWYSLSETESTSGHMVPRKKSPVTPTGIDPGTVRLAAQCLNHYATRGPYVNFGIYPILKNCTSHNY